MSGDRTWCFNTENRLHLFERKVSVQKHCPTCIVAAGLQDKPGLDVLKLRRFTENCCEDEASSDRTGGVEG